MEQIKYFVLFLLNCILFSMSIALAIFTGFKFEFMSAVILCFIIIVISRFTLKILNEVTDYKRFILVHISSVLFLGVILYLRKPFINGTPDSFMILGLFVYLILGLGLFLLAKVMKSNIGYLVFGTYFVFVILAIFLSDYLSKLTEMFADIIV